MSFLVQADNANYHQHLLPLSSCLNKQKHFPISIGLCLTLSFKENNNSMWADSNCKELILIKTICCRKKRCVNFIPRLKSWVNYVCLSSDGANQLFVYLAAPRVLAHMPAWSASLVTQVRTLPASLGHKTACVKVCV